MSFNEPLSFFQRIPDRVVEVTGSPTDRVQLGSIDGEAAQEILIRFWIINTLTSAARDLKVYPNGVEGNAGVGIAAQTGTAGSQFTRSSCCFVSNTQRERFSGYIRFQTVLNPLGTSVNFNRRFEGFTTLGDDPVVASTCGYFRANGWWEHGDGALTDLDIVMTNAASATLAAGIGVGSIFQLWAMERL